MFSRNRSAPGDDLIVDKGADDWSAFGDPRRTIGPKGRADMEMDIAITQMTKAARARAGEGSFCRLACIDHEGRPPRHQIGKEHVGTPVTNAHLVARLLLEKKHTKF